MLIIDKDTLTIKVIAKDSGDFVLTLDNYLLASGDEVVFTVSEEIGKENYVIQKRVTEFNDGSVIIFIAPKDTDLPLGEYYYDIQINAADGRVDTVVGPAKFKVIGGVTY